MKNKLLALFVILSLSSCTYLDLFNKRKVPEISFLEKAPKVSLKEFFNGDIKAFAITKDANDKIISSYTSKMKGEWDENKGVLKKNYYYNNGKSDNRTWLITDNKDGTFDAVGHDMAEPATGTQVANAVQMLYALFIPENGVKTKVRFEDSYYLVDKNSMISISTARSENGKLISNTIISLTKESE